MRNLILVLVLDVVVSARMNKLVTFSAAPLSPPVKKSVLRARKLKIVSSICGRKITVIRQ